MDAVVAFVFGVAIAAVIGWFCVMAAYRNGVKDGQKECDEWRIGLRDRDPADWWKE